MQIGILHVRRSVFIAASCTNVWQHFTSEEALAAWFGRGHRIEKYLPGADGSLELSVEIEGQRRSFGGKIRVWEPAAELSLVNDWFVDSPWPVPTFLTFRLSPVYDGALVELFHHGFERMGAEAGAQLQAYEAGWDLMHLQALGDLVEGA